MYFLPQAHVNSDNSQSLTANVAVAIVPDSTAREAPLNSICVTNPLHCLSKNWSLQSNQVTFIYHCKQPFNLEESANLWGSSCWK